SRFLRGSNLIHLPRTSESTGLQMLVDQLVTWEPGLRGSKHPQDGPMARWFAVTRARIFLGHRIDGDARPEQPQTNIVSPFAMRRSLPPGLGRRKAYGGYRR